MGANNIICATDDESRVSCNRNGTFATTFPNNEIVSSFWAGFEYLCAVPVGGSLTCGSWLDDDLPEDTAAFETFSFGRYNGCGLRADGSFECFGRGSSVLNAPYETFATIAVDEELACGITDDDGRIVCWGNGDYGQAMPPPILR
jgi:hypothetical protein